MKSFLKKMLFFVPILVGAAIFYYMAGHRQPPALRDAGERALAVRVVTAQKVPVVPRVHGFGAVKPGRDWTAISQVSGEIVKIHPGLKKGGILPAGTTLVEISKVDYELAIAQAKANIRSTEARIKELGVSRTNTMAILEIEREALKIREGELARQATLVKQGTVSRTAYDRERRDTFNQRKKVRDLENALRLIPTQLEVQREQKAVYEAQLESARQNLKRTTISLPFRARISSVNVQVAQFAQPGLKLATADGIEVAEIEAQIPIDRFFGLVGAAAADHRPIGLDERTLERLRKRLGLKVFVVLKAGRQVFRWDARFARISDSIDPKTRTIGVIAAVDGAYAKAAPGVRPPLSKGLFVEVEITANPIGPYIIVPRLAVHGARVFVVGPENRLEIRNVNVGLVQGDFSVVTSGLKVGDRVVVSDINVAIKGMLLTPRDDGELAKALVTSAKTGANGR